MAEPAWVLRARRTRSRRYMAHGGRTGRLSRDRARSHWTLPAWLVLLFDVVLHHIPIQERTRRAYRAAQAARAVLENIPAADTALPLHTPKRHGSAFVGSFLAIPLRYAAHLVTITLVLTIVLVFAGESWRAGVLQIGDTGVGSSRRGGAADPQVQRVISTRYVVSDDVGGALPVVRVFDPELAPAFIENHRLVEGETLGGVASFYQVSVAALFWANGLQGSDFLAAGRELRIPRLSGVPHIIQPGETLESIAAQYQVSPQAISLFKANRLNGKGELSVGQEIFIPGAMLPYPAEVIAKYGGEEGLAALKAVTAGVVQESETNLRAGPGRAYPRLEYLDAGVQLRPIARYEDWVRVETGAGGDGWVRADLIGVTGPALAALPETNDFPPPPPRWVWPTRGSITSRFGWRSIPYRSFHDGLDIANRSWTPIVAARSGRVIEAGWCSGFGYCVKLDHGEGITTIYGHLIKKPPVSVGDSAEVGEVIGYMGSTYDARGGGYSTGVHLHFTIKVNGNAVNPLKFLP
jgi:murein DD-endopeptidase MepM/ murein hydrolase activator NlpD